MIFQVYRQVYRNVGIYECKEIGSCRITQGLIKGANLVNYLYLGCNGTVSALDPASGQEVWRTKLETDGVGIFGGAARYQDVNVIEDDGIVVAGVNGYGVGLDAQSGTVLWQNELKGMGFNDVTMCIGGKTIQTVGKPKESD